MGRRKPQRHGGILMAKQHCTIVVANVPAALGAICGSMNVFKWFGAVLSAALPAPIAGNVWTAPVPSGNASTLFAWGIWLSMDPGTLLTKLQTLAGASTIKLYTWDPNNETFGAYGARWKTTSGWIDSTAMGGSVPPVVVPTV